MSTHAIEHFVAAGAHHASAAHAGKPDWDPVQAALGHGQWWWEPRAACWHLSPTCAQLLGYGLQEITLNDQAWLARVHADDRARLTSCMQGHGVAVDEFWQCDFRLAEVGTGERWLLLRGTVIARDAAGAPLHVMGTCTDLSAVPHASQTMRGRDQRLSAALEQAQIAWFERDLSTDIGVSSPSLAAIYGLDDVDRPWHFDEIRARIVPEDLAAHRREFDHSLATPVTDSTTRTMQYRIRRPDGELRHLEVRYRNVFDDGRGRAFGLIFDVTATKALESKFQDAMEYARMAWFERDLVTDEMRGSRSMWQIYGFDPDHQPLYFTDILSHLHPDDVLAHPAATDVLRERSRALHGVPERGNPEVLVYRVLTSEQELRWVEVRYRLRLDGHGGGSVTGLVVDVTATKQAELERGRLHRQLQQAQKMESIGLLTGGIAHDFNNILASILGYSGLALQRFSDRVPEKLVDYLKEVQTAGGRARDLVAQMLAFGRGESGELVSMNIHLVLEQTIKMLRPTLPASIEIKTAVESDLPLVLADPVQLQQVVLNLSINARDAMAGSGNIALSLRRRQIAQGHCASCHHEFNGDFVVLGVADDGPGIPDTTQSRIFEPFFSTKAAGRGAGMGLAMVHGIVHRHQGHILLQTSPDAGCAFEILLPLEQSAQQLITRTEAVDIASYEASGPTAVLVVDDERAVASFVGELLELNGYTVTVKTDPSQAWELFAANPQRFDLVVTDQTMPRLSGAQLAARVMGVRPDLPVVLMTGYSATIDERKARDLGIHAYLRKPIRGDELLAAIASAVEHNKSAA